MLKDLSNAEHEVAGLKNHNSGRACTVTVTAGGRVVMQHTNSDLISQCRLVWVFTIMLLC